MHIHWHRGWCYVIHGNGDVLHKSLFGWVAAKWARDNYRVELDLPEEPKQ